MIPAIDVRGGRCVRLLRGDYAREKVYGEDPAQRAQEFVAAGARRVHMVDLDAARGRPDPRSREAVRRAVTGLVAAGVDVQLGGGVRDQETAGEWLSVGVSWVVLGSVAMRLPDVARAICHRHPGRILLGLDVRGETAQSQGWTEDAGNADAILEVWSSWPAAGIIRTDVDRDGALSGPNLEALRACIERYPGPVIASGGISGMDDLRACAAAGAAGAITGRAVYEGRLDLGEAFGLFPAVPASRP